MCMMSKKVRSLAYKTNTPRLQGSVSVSTAMEIMDIYEIDLIAVECEHDFAGVFSRGDYTRNVMRQNLNPDNTTLYEVMTLNPPSIEPDATVKEAYEAMLSYQWEYMPVLDGRNLCGIIAMKDISQDVLQSFEDAKAENEMIMNYIHGGESYAIADYQPQQLKAAKK